MTRVLFDCCYRLLHYKKRYFCHENNSFCVLLLYVAVNQQNARSFHARHFDCLSPYSEFISCFVIEFKHAQWSTPPHYLGNILRFINYNLNQNGFICLFSRVGKAILKDLRVRSWVASLSIPSQNVSISRNELMRHINN